jgi:diguanylate cyclase
MSKSQASNGRGQAADGCGASAADMIEPDLTLQLAPIGMQGSGIDGQAVYSALLDAHADQVRERVMSTQRTGDTMQLPQLREANAQLLLAALEAASLTKLAVREYAALARTSCRDALTHTPDRALMHDRLEQAVSLARRRGNRVAVFFIDLDDFKQINDTLGHAAGDEALRLVARRLESVVRDSDTVSRHGGDEFLVLLTDVGQPSDATAVAASVLAALAEPAQVSGHAIVLSASLGVAIFPDDGDDVDSLVARADAAMYQAKYAGGQRFICGRDPHAPGAAPAGGGNGASRHARERKHSLTVEHSAGYRELHEANARLESAARSAHEKEARARHAQHPQIAKLTSARAVLRQPLEPIRRAAALLEHALADKGLLTRLQGIIEGQLARLSLLIDDVHGGAGASVRKPGDERGTVDLLDILCLAVAQSGRTLTARRQTLTRVMDHAQPVQLAGGLGDAFAAHAQHVRDQLLGHHQLVAGQPVQRQQQPAAQLLVDGVVAIAHGRLRHLRDQGLAVAQHQVQQITMARDLIIEAATRQPVGLAAALHDRLGLQFRGRDFQKLRREPMRQQCLDAVRGGHRRQGLEQVVQVGARLQARPSRSPPGCTASRWPRHRAGCPRTATPCARRRTAGSRSRPGCCRSRGDRPAGT